MGVYDNQGKPVYVVHVGTGFTQQLLDSLLVEFKKIKTNVAPFSVRGMEGVTWLEPKLVCEVIYQVVTKDCRLRMPRLHTLRFDKNPEEFSIDQIEGKGKCFIK